MSAAPAIEVHALRKRFAGTAVLAGVDLSVARGERLALVGANGAGKTTLVRCLLGEYVHEGEVRIGGRPPRRHRREVLSRIGFVPQIPPPLRMPAAELLRFASGLGGADPDVITDVAARLGLDLEEVARRPFAKLSGGQQQKLLIALALGRPTDLLVLDEPAANLDPEGRRAFLEILAARAGSTTMLLSSHRIDEIAPLVGRVVELDRGKIVLDDRVAESAGGRHLRARISLLRPDAKAAETLAEWGFRVSGERAFEGRIAGADRLRFLGLVSRYSGLVESVHLEQERSP